MHDVLLGKKVLEENDAIAGRNRAALGEKGIFTVNMVSAPGAGKTSIIQSIVPAMKTRAQNIAVIEGDLACDLDCRRLAPLGIPLKQITTGKACHLDAHQISHALPWVLAQKDLGLLIIENVGNMVCPAEYDLGEDMVMTVLSAAEGDDKPLKYPAIFAYSDLLVINKTDLVPHTDFEVERARANAVSINPALRVIAASCRSGEGIAELAAHICEEALSKRVKKLPPISPDTYPR